MNDYTLAALVLVPCFIMTALEIRHSAKIRRQIAEHERTIQAFDKLIDSSRKQIAETARSAKEAQMGADRP